jgi:NADPH-dependent curcumin reductase CurA
VDCYFDNVGGDMSMDIIQQMNPRKVLMDVMKLRKGRGQYMTLSY